MVSEQDVAYVAELAHLELTPAERTRMLKDLNSILAYVERLDQLDTSNVEPMAQVSSRYGAAKKVSQGDSFAYAMRPDQPAPCLPHDEAMQNAPQTDGTFFKVPKVIER
jgi:aspartyl-tRNA(Asn)/glutamyl-tRNA(Gln) amidotransferase subunit C